jgi:hypothetical protein
LSNKQNTLVHHILKHISLINKYLWIMQICHPYAIALKMIVNIRKIKNIIQLLGFADWLY